MKKNMKKLASLLFMAMLVLGLTACGSAEESVGTVVESAYADSIATDIVSILTQMNEEALLYYIDMDTDELQEMLGGSESPVNADAFQDIFSGYLNDLDVYGDYVSIDSYELSGNEEEATHLTNLTFTSHPAIITLVFDEDGIVTTGSIDPVYSFGEILQKAGLNTLIGMGTVFVVLIFISFVIALLPKLTAVIEGTGKKKETASAPKAAPAPAEAPAPAAVKEELSDDLALVAVISAAIATYTGTSTDGFVVRSIKRSASNKWKKA